MNEKELDVDIQSNAIIVLGSKDIKQSPGDYEINSILIPVYVSDNGSHHLTVQVDMQFIYKFQANINETDDYNHIYTGTNILDIEKQDKYTYKVRHGDHSSNDAAHIHFAPFNNEGEKVINVNIKYDSDIIQRAAILIVDNPRNISEYSEQLGQLLWLSDEQLKSHTLLNNMYVQYFA